MDFQFTIIMCLIVMVTWDAEEFTNRTFMKMKQIFLDIKQLEKGCEPVKLE